MNMSNQIKGKRKDNGEWAEGYYVKSKYYEGGTTDFIIDTDSKYDDYDSFYPIYKIIPETLGEYTGLTDKNGKRIFEGDILINNENLKGRVTFMQEHCAFMIYIPEENRYCYLWDNDFTKIEVIGNIHDNPELLED